jgi:protein arginine N-methyltransferase 1
MDHAAQRDFSGTIEVNQTHWEGVPLMALKPETVLQRVPELKITLLSNNHVLVELPGRVLDYGYYALRILDAFYQPATMQAVVETFKGQTSGVHDWIEFTSTLVQLYNSGVLQDITEPAGEVRAKQARGYASWPIHIAMLDDHTRTRAFLAAIREVVTPDDIVVDIGTGTGVLAVAAAQAGAKHVYAVEATSMADIAMQVFEANHVANRVTIVRGWSTHIDLPQRATVLVSEMIGNDPLDENLIAITRDAVQRLLQPGARLIPSRIRIYGLPVTIPPDRVDRVLLSDAMVTRWQAWYGINFNLLAETSEPENARFGIRPHKTQEWPRLSEPVLLADLDLHDLADPVFDHTLTTQATHSGLLNGVMLYPDVQLSQGQVLSRHPDAVDISNHWQNIIWALHTPFPVQAGDSFSIRFQFQGTGHATLDVQPGG